ncbi:MAG: hypothetical protein Q8K60_07520 [Parachlamydiaceae bacterium]|nr:hypothetical protein [Parachlamydiaceae bacterium]
MLENDYAKVDLNNLKSIMLEGHPENSPSSSYNQIIDLFNDLAFCENPYQYVLEDLIDSQYSNRAITYSRYKLIKNLPNFDEALSENLLKKIAQKRFQSDSKYNDIMKVFNQSLHFDEFVMRFEYSKKHLKINQLQFVIKNLFHSASELKLYFPSKELIESFLYDCEE